VGTRQRLPLGRVDLCSTAARGGHLEVLQWARANGCPWDEDLFRAAAKEATWRCCSGHAPTAAPGTS
jgi:hypothetical protein